jgi:hypothetical protein
MELADCLSKREGCSKEIKRFGVMWDNKKNIKPTWESTEGKCVYTLNYTIKTIPSLLYG